MIAEIGQFSLAMALLVALVQGIVPLWGAQAGRQAWMAVASPAAAVQLVLVLVAFGCLMQAFVTSDFSVVNVVANSHTAKPMLYKIAGVWGNHEGSLLLWVLILALFGAAVAAFGGNLPSGLRARVLSIQGLIGVGFLLFILFTSNPFERVFPAPLDGRGLNPLLQDPGLAFHPPFLYLGYVGFSVAFAFAVAALIEGRVDPAWARWVRPWTLAAWCFLTCGIALGSWWAYYELGWGGWWFWDPVENASFMPWLAGTALLHSAVVVEKRDALKSWTILLAIVAFSFSLLGTFLVRSGVLTSVHAFATDPARGVFILAFLIVVTGGSLALFAVRAQSLKSGGLFAPISREGGLVLNNLLLGTAAATVLLGTLYPLFLDGMTGEKVSVGPPYFNGVFVPLMTPLVIFMVIGPMLRWKRGDLAGVLSRLKLAYGAVVAALVAVSVSRGGDAGLMPMLGIGLGVWLLAGTMVGWAERVRLFQIPWPESFRLIRHLRRSDWGMTIAHGAVAIMIFGIAVSDAWQIERQQNIRPGDEIDLGHYVALFEGAEVIQGPNYQALRGNFRIFRDGNEIMTMQPERRNYKTPPMDTTEAAILPTLGGDLYVVIGEPDNTGGYASRLYFKPLVSWIWGGALLMVVGGMVSLSDRKHRIGAPTRRKSTVASASAARVSP